MAAALRFVASKVCRRVLQRPQAIFTMAVKEEQRLLRLRISHGGSSLRRFISSESNNIKQHLPCATKSVANTAESSRITNTAESLAVRVEEKKRELLYLLRQMDQVHSEKCTMEKENQKLLDLLGRPPAPPSSPRSSDPQLFIKAMLGACFATFVTLYLEMEYVFRPRMERKMAVERRAHGWEKEE